MTPELRQILSNCERAQPATASVIAAVEQQTGRELPVSLRELLSESNGFEGFIGEHYFALWSTEQIVAFNQAAEVDKYAPGLLLIGSDGGGENFALDYRQNPPAVVLSPAIGDAIKDAIFVSRDLASLFERLRDPASLFSR